MVDSIMAIVTQKMKTMDPRMAVTSQEQSNWSPLISTVQTSRRIKATRNGKSLQLEVNWCSEVLWSQYEVKSNSKAGSKDDIG
jgi:hypothetical protein